MRKLKKEIKQVRRQGLQAIEEAAKTKEEADIYKGKLLSLEKSRDIRID